MEVDAGYVVKGRKEGIKKMINHCETLESHREGERFIRDESIRRENVWNSLGNGLVRDIQGLYMGGKT